MTTNGPKLPDIFLLGAPKAGTTSLANWLSQHPDVYVSVPKEPFYWSADYPALRARYGFDTQAAYAALYASSAANSALHRADGSTTYLYSECAVPDILASVEKPKFVVAVRTPVDLLVSYHRTQLVALNEDETEFGQAWRRSVSRQGPRTTTPLDPKLVDYPLVGRLGAAAERLLGLVPRSCVHFILFDDLAADPAKTWAGLTQFLGLSEQPRPAFDILNASTKTYRSESLRRLTHRPPSWLAVPMRRIRQWSRATSNPAVVRVKSAMWQAERRPEVDPVIRAEVESFFAEDIRLLGDLLERDLSHWVSVSSR